MSESDNETSSKDMEKPDLNEQRRSTLADFRQNSYEGRYRSIINKQILENSINAEELKRQLGNFMPFGKGYGDSKTTINENDQQQQTSDNLDDNIDGCDVKKEIFNRDDFKEEDESENFDDNDDDDVMTKNNE